MYMCLAYAATMPTSITVKIHIRDVFIAKIPKYYLVPSEPLPFYILRQRQWIIFYVNLLYSHFLL